MLLQLMVDAASRGWRDVNGMLSKAIVESRILPILNEKLGCQKTHNNYLSRLKFFKREYQKYSQLMGHSSVFGWDATTKKFTAPEESHPTLRVLRNKNCDDYKDLQIVIGNATATGKNSLGLSDETDVRTFGVEDRHTSLDDFVYDKANDAFVSNLNESSHQPPPLRQSSSPLPVLATSSEVHPVSISQKKRPRTDNEGNISSYETNNKAGIMEKISLSIDSIAVDFRGVHSLLEKREKDREKSEMEKREKER
ncbi:hypothetical protein Dsin_024240 [Dipteronia sinensis]|uniref:Myb/SANT-like domain-containing protein n=1 Tax=Dipteronia sinensis TaxID=43782 RepID=A0AAE0DVP2_9ROSI|nr:hypothetical protein Dsin_024240 [Dipteronia sinensis]